MIGRSGIVDWGEGCLKCAVCVKHECVYGVYDKRTFSDDIFGDTIDELCKNCFRCVQGCPKRLIHKTVNPEWEALGDELYDPELITTNWIQAQTGKIPVSGAGYGGPFTGSGFDSMWTDMSEIVRPTRDGIHGREYISTVVDIGRQPNALRFSGNGSLITEASPLVRIPIPMVFDTPPFGDMSPAVWAAFARAARSLGTLMIVPETVAKELSGFEETLVPFVESADPDTDFLGRFRMVEVPYSDGPNALYRKVAESLPDHVIAVRAPAGPNISEIVVELARGGVGAIHVAASEMGYESGYGSGRHIKDVIRDVHAALIDAGCRDEVTVLASGGIAVAEHVIKAILCGANLVTVDIPLLLALECRVCRNCVDGGECPVTISTIDPAWGSQRIVNLIGAWHNQLLEMMGAMGIREARRLRGEQGRVMFYEDLEAETFGRLFGGRSS